MDYLIDYWRNYLSIVEPLAVLAASIMTKNMCESVSDNLERPG